MLSVTKLTRILAHKDRRTSCNPSKGADGRLITTTAQLLSGWEKFLGTKFQRPTADAERNLENLVAEADGIGYDELEVCLKALRSGKATGCDNVPVEAYRGSVHATNELFRICRMMWHSERIPPELVRGTFIMLHKKGSRDDMANYRAICLLCHSYKLLSAVVARRLMVVLDERLPDASPTGHPIWIPAGSGMQGQRVCPQIVHRHGPPGRKTSCRHRHWLQCCVWHGEPAIPW